MKGDNSEIAGFVFQHDGAHPDSSFDDEPSRGSLLCYDLVVLPLLLIASTYYYDPRGMWRCTRNHHLAAATGIGTLRNAVDKRHRSAQQQGGIGETAAGAVLGGLLGGPFGALFGASVGSRMGAQKALNRARQQEMERLGLTQEMLDTANGVGLALERSNEGLRAVQDSLDTQQRLARRLEADATQLYEKAQIAMTENEEQQARQWLMQRTEVQDKLKQVLKNCAEERQRLNKMEDNVEQLQRRALEVETLMRRSVSAKTLSSQELSLPVEDPLLQKFKDLGID